ncbi:type VI secretion system Vgr family protein [Paraburkholderia unamae]|nr:type VI secretion system Vgr family protein [Paraburkholderia unamae]
MSIDGPALPRFTPPGPRPDWYYRVQPSATSEGVTQCVLVPIHLHGREALGERYRYTVRMRTDVRVPSVPDIITLDLDKVVGTEVTVSIDVPGRGTFVPGMPGDTGRGNIGFHVREISGRIGAARFIRRDNRSMVYEFDIEPALAKAAKGQSYRIFQNRTIIEAIGELLHPYPISIDWRIAGPLHGDHYPRRDLQRQYFESDWTCFRRWCERAGLFFWFEHSEGFHRLVIADTMGAFHPHGEAYETLRYAPGENRIDEEHIERLEFASGWTEGKATAVDHDPMQPRMRRSNMPLRESDENPRDTAEADQEFYEYANVSQPLQGSMGLHGRPLDLDEQARQVATVRMQSMRSQGFRANGFGHLRGLRPGYTFELVNHPMKKANQEWVVLSTTLTIECNDQASGTDQAFRCDCEFEIQPANNCHYRLPIITPWPVIGSERAVVTGPDDHELWVDEQGRVCCQLVPDREGKFDHKSFIWLWVVQPWQNRQMGSAFVPRIGSEVVVEHVNGNPDMPYIAGSIGGKNNPPPWALSRNMWVSGLRSREADGRGSNHLALDDTHGRQQVQLASDHAKSSLSLGYITRIDGNEGRQEERGIGAEIRTDGQATMRGADGVFLTTDGRPNAQGKVKENGETVARLTRARDVHESAAQLAQQRGAQDATGDQADVVQSVKQANAEVRGKASTGASDFPEFERPHLTLASAAGLQAVAEDDAHFVSGRHTALTAGGSLGVATGKSFFASALEKIAFYAQKVMRLIATGPVYIESRDSTMDLIAQRVINMLCTQGEIRIKGKRIVLEADNAQLVLGLGITGHTNGAFLVHAANHATADPQAKPVDYPVTQDTPGRLAAHHVLVENQGGFAIPNQPYRLTLDDGQVIQGVTNDLGEMQMATSNVATFGLIELMSQSEPGNVIGLVNTTVYHDATTEPPPPSAVMRRTTQVGGKTASTPESGATSKGQSPDFLTCDPMNFGLRTYRYVGNAAPSPASEHTRSDVEYPVAKTYTAAVKKALTSLDWAGLRSKPAAVIQDSIAGAVRKPLLAALCSGAFGLPDDAMPSIKVVTSDDAPQYGIALDGVMLAGFVAKQWLMGIVKSTSIERVFRDLNAIDMSEDETKKKISRMLFDDHLRDLAETIYHESRHCQQTFWMMSLYGTYPKDYVQFPGIATMFESAVLESVRKMAEATPFPNNDLVKIGVHRMLIFYYWWFIVDARTSAKGYKPYEPILADADKVQAEVCKLRGVTPEQALLMGQRKEPGYRSHYHEEDAYATEDAVKQYWGDADHAFVLNPGICTKQYESVLTQLGVSGNG